VSTRMVPFLALGSFWPHRNHCGIQMAGPTWYGSFIVKSGFRAAIFSFLLSWIRFICSDLKFQFLRPPTRSYCKGPAREELYKVGSVVTNLSTCVCLA